MGVVITKENWRNKILATITQAENPPAGCDPFDTTTLRMILADLERIEAFYTNNVMVYHLAMCMDLPIPSSALAGHVITDELDIWIDDAIDVGWCGCEG